MAVNGLCTDHTFICFWNRHSKSKIGWLLLRRITIPGYTFVHAHIFLVDFLQWQVMEVKAQQRAVLSKVHPWVMRVKAGIVLPPRQGQRGAAVSRRHTPEVDCVISGGDHDILWALVNLRWNFGINSKRSSHHQLLNNRFNLILFNFHPHYILLDYAISRPVKLDAVIHCGIVTPYGDTGLGQHWLR